MTPRVVTWAKSKADIALRMESGEFGAGHSEAYLILSCAFSALASTLWPGEGIDRARFVELWSTFAPAKHRANHISVPLLIANLEAQKNYAISELLRDSHEAFQPGYDCLVIVGHDVDLPEDQVRSICPALDLRQIRQYSYGNIFYKYVRSAYVHEFKTSSHADAFQMADPGYGVSYVNTTQPPYRRIHFEIEWLGNLLKSISKSIYPHLKQIPLQQPKSWWLHDA